MISGNSRIVFRKATVDDIDGIKGLADAHRHELGFLRRPSLLDAIDRSEMIVTVNQQNVVGFAEFRFRRDAQTTLYNIVVDPQWRDQGIGKKMLSILIEESRARAKQYIVLKCPEGLPANEFYRRIGCEQLRIEDGKRRRLIIWQIRV